MDDSIQALYLKCDSLLQKLAGEPVLSLDRASLTATDFEDQHERFKVWGGNLGAAHPISVKISLDWRLRDATELRNEIKELLEEIANALTELNAITSGVRDDQIVPVDADDDEGTTAETGTISESAELFGIVSDSIASLFRLSLIIQKATPRDRFLKSTVNVKEPFDPAYDIGHVGSKYPKLDLEDNVWLKSKLGNAITQRRQFLRYSRDHRERKSEPKEKQPAIPVITAAARLPQQDTTSQLRPESVAQTAASTLVLDQLRVAQTTLDDGEDGLSQTSFATSVNDGKDPGRLRVAALHDVSKRSREFECPYCLTIIAPRSQRQWKKHVFEDLRPYICTSKDCDTKLFSDRRTWFEHELEAHRHIYHCLFCKYQTSESEQGLKRHVTKLHSEFTSTEDSRMLSQATKQAPQSFSAADCPFCDEWAIELRELNPHIASDEVISVKPRQFRDHVAAHMEQLALFALPRLQDDNQDADSAAAAASRNTMISGVEGDKTPEISEPLVHDDYIFAVISASYKGFQAIIAMLDKIHPNLVTSSADDNEYCLGQIGVQNVVCVTVNYELNGLNGRKPSFINLRATFPKVKFGFSIGAGSGLPLKPANDAQQDLRLGDIVVDDSVMESVDVMLGDPQSLQTIVETSRSRILSSPMRLAITSVRNQHEDEGRRVRVFHDPLVEHEPHGQERYGHPRELRDYLFASNVEHYNQNEGTSKKKDEFPVDINLYKHSTFSRPGDHVFPPCDNCRESSLECIWDGASCQTCKTTPSECTWKEVTVRDLVPRVEREDPLTPVVHDGRVATANGYITDALLRDKLRREHEIDCVETDLTGTTLTLPCQIIRGICNYADNFTFWQRDEWQGYAISAAAAYAAHILDGLQGTFDYTVRQWSNQKTRIESLYVLGHSMTEIAAQMKSKFDFDTTPYQYQQHIEEWKLTRSPVSGHTTVVAESKDTPDDAEHDPNLWIDSERTQRLESLYAANDKPSTEDKQRYAQELGMSEVRIDNWFQNRRAKSKHEEKAEPQPEADKEFRIKCVCGYSHGNGSSILCEGCNTWQHIACYYAPDKIPGADDEHYCLECRPGLIDIDRAKAHQEREAEKINVGRQYMRSELNKKGYSDAEIEEFMSQPRKRTSIQLNETSSTTNVVAARPKFMKVSEKHMDPRTLDHYDIPWEWDPKMEGYINIEQWMDEDEREVLFEHSKRIRAKDAARSRIEKVDAWTGWQDSAASRNWTGKEDKQLLKYRSRGLEWSAIAAKFDTRTAAACRERHEQLAGEWTDVDNEDAP